MDSLFFKLPSIEKTASTAVRVSSRASDWSKEALNRFYSDFPDLAQTTVSIKFKDRDPDKGYAIGSIKFNNAVLPVIIRDFQLYPFDVVIIGDKVMPFNKTTLTMLMSKRPPFSQLAQEEEPDVYVRFFDPSYGFQPGSTMEKGSEWRILSAVEESGLCDDSLREKMAGIIANDPVLKQQILESASLQNGLKKLATLETFNEKLAETTLEFDVHYIYPNDDGTYTKLAANSNFDIEEEITGLEYYEIKDLPRVKTAEIVKTAEFSPKYTKTEGYVYKLADGETMFLNNEGNYRIIVGKDATFTKTASLGDGNADLLIKLAKLPTTGDSGVFFDPETGEIKTTIVEMRKIAFLPSKITPQVGEFSVGSHLVKFASLKGLKNARPADEDDTLYLPETWAFAKLGEILPESALRESIDPRVANLECVRCIGTDNYEFRGPVLRKYAQFKDLYEVNAHKAAFAVLRCGGSLDDTEKIANLRPGELYIVRSELHMPFSKSELGKVASDLNENVLGSDENLYDLAEILKIAAEIGDERGVDAVLGSAFLRKDTVNRFIEALPMFEETSSLLAKMLLYTRMGADGFNEEAIKRAMEHISKVIFDLYGLSTLYKKGK